MIWSMVRLALRAIRRNVLRSSLTMLGIVIGVAAVIAMVTIGAGATAQGRRRTSRAWARTCLLVRPGQGQMGPGGARSDAPAVRDRGRARDRDARSRGVAAVAPTASKPAQAIAGSRNWSTAVTGSTPAFLEVRSWVLVGRPLVHRRAKSARARPCV